MDEFFSWLYDFCAWGEFNEMNKTIVGSNLAKITPESHPHSHLVKAIHFSLISAPFLDKSTPGLPWRPSHDRTLNSLFEEIVEIVPLYDVISWLVNHCTDDDNMIGLMDKLQVGNVFLMSDH